MAEANLVNISSVIGKSISTSLNSGQTYNVQHNGTPVPETWLIKSLILANVSDNSTDCQTNVSVNLTGSDYKILHNVWIPYGTSLVVLDESTPIYLQYQDIIKIEAVSGNGLNLTMKYETLKE